MIEELSHGGAIWASVFMVIASVFGFHYKQLVKRLENLETRFNKHDVDSANREVRLETLEKNLDKIDWSRLSGCQPLDQAQATFH